METTNTSPKKKMGIGKKILIGFGILVLIGIIGNLLDKDKDKETNTLKSDVQLTQAQKDSIAKAELEEIKKNTITAKQLIAEYEANEVAADNNFKGKTFYVSGTVVDIKKDVLNHIYVTLNTDNIIRKVQCYFEDAETAAKLSKDMQVTFLGKCDGLMMNVLMKDCKLISAN